MSGIFHHLMAYVFDPFWKYVTLLLHGNGTNGAQNNTFIDSSSNAFTVTRNGTPTQGSVSPFGPDWSANFNGTSGYLNASANAVFAFGTGSFTVEAWVYLSSLQDILLFDTRTSAATTGIGFQINSSGVLCYIQSTSTSLATTALTVNTWNHVAWVYNGTSVTGYVNGVAGTSSTISLNITQNNSSIGRSGVSSASFIAGYISNLRVLKGTALYTAAFTPPTAPLTAITNTSLLTCQSNRFKDNSTNNFAITVTGTPSVQRFSPFSSGSAYSTSVIGGSGYFNGVSGSLTVPNNAAFQFGSGNFTVECWVNITTVGSSGTWLAGPWGDTTSSTNRGWFLAYYPAGGGMLFGYSTTGSNFLTIVGTTTITLNVWNHFAAVRNGSTVTIYQNGVSIGSGAISGGTIYTNTTPLWINGNSEDSGASPWLLNGYLSNFRIVKGTAVYTAAFTPPTAPLTAITNTSFLLSTINGGIYDNAMQSNLITVGNAQISTTQSKFGGASMAFDGSGDWLTANDTPNLQLGTGDFTIEGWVYLNTIGVAYGIVSKGTSTTGWSVNITSGNKLQFSYTASNLTGATSLAASTWYYFAVVRSGTATGNVKIYLNGTADVTSGTAITDNFNQTSILYVGASRTSTTALNGYIDDLRITKGVARYTANFTPPTSQFLDY